MKRLGSVGRWVLTALLLAVALRQAPPTEWLPYLETIHWEWMGVSALLMAGIVAVNTWKWQLLLAVQGIRPGYTRVLYHYGVGYFFNSFITGSGDLKRAADLGAEEGAVPETMASVLTERWTGVIGQLTLASVTLLAACLRDPASLVPLALFSGGLCGALVLAYLWLEDARPAADRPPQGLLARALAWVHRLRLALAAYRSRRLVLWAALVLSLAGPLLLVAIHWTLARALGLEPSFLGLLLFVPTISVFAQLPITINGFGLQDYFMVTLLLGTLNPGGAMALSMAFHALRLGVGAAGGLMFVLTPDMGRETTVLAR